jgi:tRNA C32,U32 (ribose-2'-O)-methylase TrmJ
MNRVSAEWVEVLRALVEREGIDAREMSVLDLVLDDYEQTLERNAELGSMLEIALADTRSLQLKLRREAA